MRGTHADLAERCGEYDARAAGCARRREAEQEDGSDAVESARFDEDPEDGKAGCVDPRRIPCFDRSPEPIHD
jgi:hypothetical protein